jgi:hypothetical protein
MESFDEPAGLMVCAPMLATTIYETFKMTAK